MYNFFNLLYIFIENIKIYDIIYVEVKVVDYRNAIWLGYEQIKKDNFIKCIHLLESGKIGREKIYKNIRLMKQLSDS